MPGAGRDPRAIQMSAAMNDYSSRSPNPDKDTQRKESQAKRQRPLVLERYSKLKALRSDLLLRLFKTPRKSGLWRWLRHCLKFLEKSFETLSAYGSSEAAALKSGGGAGEKSQSARGPPESVKSNFISLEKIIRREFLIRGAKTAAVVAGATSGIGAAVNFLNPTNANAMTFSYEEYIGAGYPPGIADAATRHPQIAQLWRDLKEGNFSDFKRLLGYDSRNSMGSISSKAWLEEPAFYFIGMHWAEFDNFLVDDDLQKANLPMKGFKDIMNVYLRKYSPYLEKRIPRNPYWMAKSNLEMGAVMTLMEASGIQPEKFKNLGYTMQGKGNYIEQLREIFKQYQTSDELQKKRTLNLITENLKSQNIVQKRIAAWTGFILTREKQKKEGENNDIVMFIYNNLEIPVSKIYGENIRHGPEYGF